MKVKQILPVAVMAFATLTGCESKKEMNMGIRPENMDLTAQKGADFYQYACGGWMAANPLTDEYSRFGSFDLLAENNREQLKGLIAEIASKEHEQGSVAQKIGDLYNLAMNTEKLNKDGMTPIQADLDKINAISDKAGIIEAMAELAGPAYFQFYVDADIMDSKMNIFQLYQGGIGLGEKEYYLEDDEATTKIREGYKAHIVKMFQLIGQDEKTATKNMEAVMEIETRLAKVSYSAVEQRNPAANYHKMTLDELKKEIPGFDWDAYLNKVGVQGVTSLNVSQIPPVKESVAIINTLPMDKQIAYLQWKLIDSAASYLSDDFVNANFEFFGKTVQGREVLQPVWKRSLSVVNRTLSEALGQKYVEKYFPASSKEKMVEMVANLQVALGERINALEWMSEETKAKAQEKLGTFIVKVGYPDKWKDYSALEIKNDSYWANMCRSSEFRHNEMMEDEGQPVDRTEWGMSPQTVNAYYNPTTNEICFPAAILQPPFFNPDADDAVNYGGIGVVIGHEMTHGFDDQGRNYDKDGNLTHHTHLVKRILPSLRAIRIEAEVANA